MPIGAEPQPDGIRFRIWASAQREMTLEVDGRAFPLMREAGGYFSATVGEARIGSRYGFRIPGEARLLPDPASRFQPDGPHGASLVVDPSSFRWTDADWGGLSLEGQVISEIHIGTFTPEGTWRAAAAKLPLLADAGISLVEMMPVADFPGSFGWGYDGVSWFAPTRLYGMPDDLRSFVDRAHALSIGVILDVNYNHFGPDGNYTARFSPDYVTERYKNEWGQAINFDGPESAPVREFVRENAAYWIREFHFDGLRLDATQQIFDASGDHVVAELVRHARAAAGPRRIVVIAENEPQHATLVRAPAAGGYGLDGLWNDDFHHASHVALTGRNEAYYSDYAGTAAELLACARHGFLFQGQRSAWQGKRRGMPAFDLDPRCRINFLENHDQVANSSAGQRLAMLTDAALLRALTGFLLLGPGTPMLFQGQEFGCTSPFLFFADHRGELAEAVAKGRRGFMLQFPSLRDVALDRPDAAVTFRKCCIDWSERDRHAPLLRLHRDLIRLRRRDPVLAAEGVSVDGALLGEDAFLLRFFGTSDDRLLIVNLGITLAPQVISEPLIAPRADCDWRLVWSSEDPAYGGRGIGEVVTAEGNWTFPGRSTALLAPTASKTRDA